MKYDASHPIAALMLVAALAAPALAAVSATARTPPLAAPQQQTPTPAPRPTPGPDDDVVRITSNLVQIDATVTDRDGRVVADLRPEDFEIHVGGKRQEITNFSFVSAEPSGAAPAAAPPGARPSAGAPVPVPPARLSPGKVQRTIALVVDDLGTSFESVAQVRRALKKFVDEQMQPGDLVAVMRTSAGMGSLQQFTSDRRLLHAAIEKVRWYPAGRGGVSPFAAIEPDPLAQAREQLDRVSQGSEEERARRERSLAQAESLDEFREQIFSVGTLGALNYIVRGLRELPGRKSVVLLSDGFEIFNKDRESNRVLEALRRLADLANRASVVVYTLDARGLQTLGLTAADNVGGLTPQQIGERLTERRDKLFNTQEGMYYLAEQTGGFFIRNNNDIAAGIRRVLEDQRGYYLIGYRPDEETFDPVRGRGRFNKVEVKVRNRSGLRVRTRSGFFGFTENEARAPAPTGRREQLSAAIYSPFALNDIPLRLTSLFSHEGERRDIIGTFLHIDASGFKFEEEADGWRKATMDIVALTFGDNGQVIDEVNRTETIRARDDAFESLVRDGLIFSMQLPVKKPGAYQLRVAVRDAGSERTGSASQFVEAPDLSKGRLALSGIIMTGSDNETAASAAPGSQAQGDKSASFDPMATPAVRRFRQGASVDYYLQIYNARLDPSGRPRLQYQSRIFRDGQPVFTGRAQPYAQGQQQDPKRLLLVNRLNLGRNLPPGEYVLQLVVTDTLAKEKHQVATQWIDFEIVK